MHVDVFVHARVRSRERNKQRRTRLVRFVFQKRLLHRDATPARQRNRFNADPYSHQVHADNLSSRRVFLLYTRERAIYSYILDAMRKN